MNWEIPIFQGSISKNRSHEASGDRVQHKILIWVTAVFLLGLGTAGNSHAEGDSLLDLIPGNSQIAGLELKGTPRQSEGTNLFAAINGEAELYFRFGFKRALFANYKSPSGQAVSVDLFEMSDSTAAQKVFSIKSANIGKPVNLGDGAILGPYYLIFFKENIQVIITGLVPDKADNQELLAIAGLIAKNIR